MPEEYDILEHGLMLGDRLRLGTYLEAIRRAVAPGSVVVDIGSGTGVFALAACRAGARRVYAIEPGAIVRVAREVASANGCAAQIEFIEELSTNVTLPERADVIVLDVRGVLPDEQIPVALDARHRFLRNNGRIIPSTDTLWAAPVSAPGLYDEHVATWDCDEAGLDLSPLRSVAVNRWYKCRVTPDQLASKPRPLGTIDYHRMDEATTRLRVTWMFDQPALVHGVVVWFDSVLHEGLELSNRPGAPDLLYGQGFFPWPKPMALDRGEIVDFELSGAVEVGSYRWRVNTSITYG